MLDLFSGDGGAGEGYSRAGMRVFGVDLYPKPHNPHPRWVADAVAFVREHGRNFDFVHASPPCQAYSTLRHRTGNEYPRLIEPVREALVALGKPYVIENVVGAPLVEPTLLCGSMFGLGSKELILKRHRLFEASFPVVQPVDACRGKRAGGVYGHLSRSRAVGRGTKFTIDEAEEAMGIDWMSKDGLSQAIPPVYTQYIAEQWLSTLTKRRARG